MDQQMSNIVDKFVDVLVHKAIFVYVIYSVFQVVDD